MSEAELHFLRLRMHEGRLNKARRGELFNHVPIGYVREPGGGLALDPDEQAQQVVRMVFDQFDRQGSLHGLLRYLVHHSLRLPVRPHYGPNRGKLEWRRPNRETLQNMLHHPLYAGYYRHGHRALDPRRKVPGRPGTGRTINQPENCLVLLENRCPAYITAQRFWANQERLAANRARTEAAGAVRQGPSLLGGILRCGRCGQRMMVAYSGRASRLRYSCSRAMVEYAEPLCQGLAGRVLDDLVAAQVLAVLQPAALELNLAAADDIEQERARLHRNWQQQLERARYQAERAQRQHDAVEPENRLVVRELERAGGGFEGAASSRGGIRPVLPQPARGSVGWRARPNPCPGGGAAGAVAAPTTTAADRQRIVRLLVKEVVATVRGESERVDVTIHWAGGFSSSHELVRPVQRYQQMADYGRLLNRIDELRKAGQTLARVAEQLNREGFHPPKRSATFTSGILASLLAQRGRSGPRPRAVAEPGILDEHEWLLTDLARKLEMPRATLHHWVRVGWVQGRKLPTPGGHWVIWADADELDRMTRLRTCPRGWSDEHIYAQLIKPKARDDE